MGTITKKDMIDATLQVHGAGEYVPLTYAKAVIERLEEAVTRFRDNPITKNKIELFELVKTL